MPNFDDFGLSSHLLRSLREMGFEEPTPVQALSIPPLLAGKDVVAQALTGTGKTAAYGIPLVERIDPRLKSIQAIVLSPTRELAVQVEEQLSHLSRFSKLQFLAVYGGQPIERQLRALSRGVHGIVATPGRLMDHMRRRTVDLSAVETLILDEADQMLQMGFQEDVEYVISELPSGRHTALFSATMPGPILKIVDNYMNRPQKLHLSRPKALTVPSVAQTFLQVPFPRKFDALCAVLDSRQLDRTLVFCATKRMVDEVAERLPTRGYSAQALHGDVAQAGRERALKAFGDGRTDVLVATDVAARGLDIPDVTLVLNFDIPPDPEYYVHRIGRTGRSGRPGDAITFVNPREMREFKVIERVTGAQIRRAELPTQQEAEQRAARQLESKLRDTLQGTAWRGYLEVVDSLSDVHDVSGIAAAALALYAGQRRPLAKFPPAKEKPSDSPELPDAQEKQQDSLPRPPGPEHRPRQRRSADQRRRKGSTAGGPSPNGKPRRRTPPKKHDRGPGAKNPRRSSKTPR